MSPFAQCLGSPIALLGGGSAAPSDTILFFLERKMQNRRDAGPISRTAALAAGILASGKQRRPRVPLPGFLPRAGRKLMTLCPRFLTVTERCCRNSPPAGLVLLLIKRSQTPSLRGVGRSLTSGGRLCPFRQSAFRTFPAPCPGRLPPPGPGTGSSTAGRTGSPPAPPPGRPSG